MSLLGMSVVADLVKTALDAAGLSSEQREKAAARAFEVLTQGDFEQRRDRDVSMAQANINKVEAASTDLFRAGWRPATGWVCVIGLAVNYLVSPMLPWVLSVFGVQGVPPIPQLDVMTLMSLLGALLGLGGFRTIERLKGKA